MFRFIELEIPKSTPESNPATKLIQLTQGEITDWWVGFRHGCLGRVHITIYEFEHQILPRGEDEDLYWSGYTFHIPDSYLLEEQPYRIEVRGWNEDTTNPHTVVVGVALQPIPEETTESLLRRLLRAFVGE